MAVLDCPDLDGYGEGYGAEYGAGEAKYHSIFMGLLPRGKAWTRRACSNMSKLSAALAAEFQYVALQRDDMVLEADPRQAFHSLDDWEEMLNLPGNCEENYPTTVAGRRSAIHARLGARGEQTPDFYQAIGVSLGYTDLTFSKYETFTCKSRCTARLFSGQWAYAILVTGSTGLQDEVLECMFDDAAPIHTTFVFELT